ncbi:exosortase family protein XrtF [Flavobacterium buctense]|uniref:Exosortase family protein XrtF n=1 Tax=Flavobacterium buctense TaxID=1648146 RepID=A0ABU9E3J7_9FLAO|nr:exosortase family protein XrtF [Flavobacterium buctense]
MKNLLQQYKPFLLFLGKFLLTYLLLTIIYQSYLSRFDASKNEVDSFSQLVANQTKSVLTLFDTETYIESHPTEPSIKIIYKGQYISRIIEGCNALSVIILFISFVIAFTGKWKKTLLFILLGSVLIHVLNIARIALLCIALYSFPEYEHILHGVVFPLVIYGIVFLLWVIWVNKFSLHATVATKK